ncbi:S9 family peptidase [Granulicella cerasi]|uniref:S9 family peptidase n=1 Tax=Granulicella cerasi TaxID=741063 RepID=A0ABW1ZC75_9BACT|nr:S9 family peptidase [Granulicella cerasi]
MRAFALPLSLLLFTSSPFAVAQAKRFSADDLPRIVRVGSPQLSPDGKTISITVGRANLKEDRIDSELVFVDVASKTQRVMTHDRSGLGNVKWSPNGDRIAFLAQDKDRKAQIFVMPVNGGDAEQVTHSKTSIQAFTWRPDGKAFAFTAADEVPEKKDEAKFEDAFEVGNNSYLERTAAVPVHLWTIELGAQAKRLTNGAWSVPQHMAPSGPPAALEYTPDGKSLVFEKADSPITGESDSARVVVMDVASGAMHTLTNAKVAEGSASVSPDGSMVAYEYPREGHQRFEETVYVAPLTAKPGDGHDVAYALDHAVGDAQWFADGKALLLKGADGTKSRLWVQPLEGKAKAVELGALTPGASDLGKDGALAFTATDGMHPAELFYVAHLGDAPVQMTHLQTVTEGMTLGKQETVTWKSDNFTVDGVLTYPPDYTPGKKLPLVLYIHGGPTATSLETFTTASQILAAQGWLVLEPNYRGSNNEGNAFESSIINHASAAPGRDIMAGVKAIEARGIVDSSRIAVSGWSYGGQMTAWMIGAYPTMWKAAVAGAPVTDLVDQYTLSDNNVERAAGYGPSPFVGKDAMKLYAEESPITHAWAAKTPTLIMSDVGDWRVTTTQAYKLYHALKDNNVPVKFVAYPVPGHSPADPIRSRDVWRRWTAWLHQYLDEPATK